MSEKILIVSCYEDRRGTRFAWHPTTVPAPWNMSTWPRPGCRPSVRVDLLCSRRQQHHHGHVSHVRLAAKQAAEGRAAMLLLCPADVVTTVKTTHAPRSTRMLRITVVVGVLTPAAAVGIQAWFFPQKKKRSWQSSQNEQSAIRDHNIYYNKDRYKS